MMLRTKIIYIDFHKDIYFCNILKIAIIYVLLFYLSPFSCDLVSRGMFAAASLEMPEEFRLCTSHAFPVRSTAALFSPLSVLNGLTLREGVGGLKVSV